MLDIVRTPRELSAPPAACRFAALHCIFELEDAVD